MSLFLRAGLIGCLGCAAPLLAPGQTNYVTNGVEYAVAGTLPQDQVKPWVALSSSGGYLVWEDNITDGNGLGISALQMDSGFSGVLSPFRVNSIGAGDQENPQVALLQNGGAVFVWQGGVQGFQHIYARFLSSSKTWLANDAMVNTFTGNMQITPAVTVLTNGNVVVTWASYNEVSSSSMLDVYAQILTPTGAKSGGEFLVNQFTSYNQRTPAIAALSNGRFVIVWVSEQERWTDLAGPPSVDIYGRVYDVYGSAVGNEFLVNTSSNICANPSVAAGSDGGFIVTWGQKDLSAITNSWDVFARSFSSTLAGGTTRRVNTFTFGDQYAPRIAATGTDYFAVWTSLGQDGSQEGVYGQVLHNDGTPWGGEMLINTTVINGQIQPCIASDGAGRFLPVWSSYVGNTAGFDLYAQRFAKYQPPLPAMNPPLVYVPFVVSNRVYQPEIEVFWTAQSGMPVDHYEVYVNGSGAPAVSLNTNFWLMTAANGLTAGSSNSFQVLYATTDGRRSPLSAPTGAATWSGLSYYGIPVEWMEQYWGSSWPLATAPVAPDGPTPLQAFLTGANPLDPRTWLRTSLSHTPQGYYLSWNPQPGLTYQAQSSTSLGSWANLGSPRFAPGNLDSLYLGVGSVGYYRVLCLH
ncbi:MAG TPA: hypothetical protein VMU04_19390 [Candidatus Acidoferrum sp.]|nr:hypothetical protein [Candidatus Acidoferrum sp.]